MSVLLLHGDVGHATLRHAAEVNGLGGHHQRIASIVVGCLGYLIVRLWKEEEQNGWCFFMVIICLTQCTKGEQLQLPLGINYNVRTKKYPPMFCTSLNLLHLHMVVKPGLLVRKLRRARRWVLVQRVMHWRLDGLRHMLRLMRASSLLIVFLIHIISVVAAFGLQALLTLSPPGERHVHITQAFTHRGDRRNKLDAGGRKECSFSIAVL